MQRRSTLIASLLTVAVTGISSPAFSATAPAPGAATPGGFKFWVESVGATVEKIVLGFPPHIGDGSKRYLSREVSQYEWSHISNRSWNMTSSETITMKGLDSKVSTWGSSNGGRSWHEWDESYIWATPAAPKYFHVRWSSGGGESWRSNYTSSGQEFGESGESCERSWESDPNRTLESEWLQFSDSWSVSKSTLTESDGNKVEKSGATRGFWRSGMSPGFFEVTGNETFSWLGTYPGVPGPYDGPNAKLTPTLMVKEKIDTEFNKSNATVQLSNECTKKVMWEWARSALGPFPKIQGSAHVIGEGPIHGYRYLFPVLPLEGYGRYSSMMSSLIEQPARTYGDSETGGRDDQALVSKTRYWFETDDSDLGPVVWAEIFTPYGLGAKTEVLRVLTWEPGSTSASTGTGIRRSPEYTLDPTDKAIPYYGQAGIYNVRLLPFEVNVDADNTTVEGYPDTSKGDLGGAERAAQNSDDEERYPGVRVYANLIDADTDGVVGYADGIDKFDNGQANSCWKFEPMLISIPSLENFPNTKFVFKYSSSDPDQMTREGSGLTARYILPQGKILRLWKKDGDEVRKPQSAHQNGDFIRADQEYTPQQLGWQQGDTTMRLYMEVVDTSTFDQSTPIDVEFYPVGKDHPESVAKERIKVRPYYISRENPDTNNAGL